MTINRTNPRDFIYRIHDGSPEQTTITLPDVGLLIGLEWDDARRRKDLAVSRHKYRKASIVAMTEDEVKAFLAGRTVAPEPVAPEPVAPSKPAAAPAARPSVMPIRRQATGGFVPANQPNPDAQLEAARQKSLAAARTVAAQAQARATAAATAPKKPEHPIVGLDPVDALDDGDEAIGDDLVHDMLAGGTSASADDVKRAQAQLQAEQEKLEQEGQTADREDTFALREAAGQARYELDIPTFQAEGLEVVPWKELPEATKVEYRMLAKQEADAAAPAAG